MATTVIFFFVILLTPVFTTPGNDVFFQIHIWGLWLTMILVLLSLSNGLLIAMQVYAWRHGGTKDTLGAGKSFLGVITGLIVSIFACAACYSTLLALVGLGFATFVVKHRIPLLIVAFCMVGWSIYGNAKRIAGHCDACRLVPTKKSSSNSGNRAKTVYKK